MNISDDGSSGYCRTRRDALRRFPVAGRMLQALAAAIPALALAACAASTSKVRVQQADTDLTACRTFDWLAVRDVAASLNEQRIRAAAMRRLQDKGYELSPDRPDCRITYVLLFRESAAAKPRVAVGAGGGSRGMVGGIGVSVPISRKERQSATFMLDVIDVASNAQVWSGSLDTSFASRELTQEEADTVVERILAAFP
ncbi:hypothetical protein ACG33_14030 [Steroidobacter denitrificans]|uniref:DUF4136 domain-containing protein n=1 Tax=Steroidobacter denitrificans TaxID=465721 RepID=A0A127FEA9_STEDE|nr:DUF4136 domain-containing protein [Steroidobacter denitrificans]AMN48195.1 hypothetical protein ACG33_14030 [Steroidobacter denitrificans]